MDDTPFYQKDLAFVHHHGYSHLSEEAARFIIDTLKAHQLPQGLIIDLGCGSGKLVQKLSQHGYPTMGVDLSPELIEIAKEQSPQTEFLLQSIWEMNFKPCVAVSAIGEIMNYRKDDQNHEENVIKLFQHIYSALEKGGIFLFDFLAPDVLCGKEYDSKIVEGEDWDIWIAYREDKAHRTFQRDITLFRKLPNGLYRKSRETHHIRLFDIGFIVNTLTEIGFEVKPLKTYGETMMRDKHHGMLAIK